MVMALITGSPRAALMAATRCGRLAAMQLEEIGANSADDRIDQRIVGIN